MFVIKEYLRFGEDYLSYTAAENETECYSLFTGCNTQGDISKLNKLLEENYGILMRGTDFLPIYEIICIKSGLWTCENCGITVFQNSDNNDMGYFTVKNSDGDIMGSIFRDSVSEIVLAMQLLNNGGCPVCDGWDDGIGNTCSPSGWGKTEFFFKNCRKINRL